MKNRLNWKHITLLAVALVALIGLFAVTGSAEDDPPEVNPVVTNASAYRFYVEFDKVTENGETFIEIGKKDANDNYVKATTGNSWGYTSFVIPQKIKWDDGVEYPVKRIAKNAFAGESRITDIAFYEGLKEIGESAFSGTSIGINSASTQHGTITIPTTVTSIGASAFANCYLLNKVTIANNGNNNADAIIIGDQAFAGCYYNGNGDIQDTQGNDIGTASYITEVTINRSVEIGASAFSGSHVGSVSIPYATKIGNYAFQNAALTEFTIPATLTEIGEHAFSGNNAAFELDENDPNYATTKVFEITSAAGGTEPLSIGAYAFSDDTANLCVTEVALPNDNGRNITIGNCAFKGNTGMTSLNFGRTVTVGDHAFENCGPAYPATLSTYAAWPATITSVGVSAFDNCRLLDTVDASNVATIGTCGFRGSSIRVLTLPDWTDSMSMGTYAFAGLDRLQSVIVPDTWETLPDGFFKAIDGAVAAPGLQTVLFEGATAIGNEAFKGCTNLSKVTGATVPSVGESAFEGCTALNKSGNDANFFALPDATTISKKAFYNCTGLRAVEINTATTIGESAFEDCSGMTGLSMNAAQTIGVKAFKNAGASSGVTALAWPSTVTSIGSEAFYSCTLLGAVTMASNTGLNHIGTSAFENSSLTSLTLPAAQPSVYGEGYPNGFADAKYIFKNCDSLNTAVTIPYNQQEQTGWTLVPEETFAECDLLPSVTVEGPAVLSKKAFYNCDALTTVNANPAASIGEETFADCGALTTVYAQSAATVGQKAFFLCPELADVDIHAAATVGDAAFFNCTKLATLDISSLTTVDVEAFAKVGTYTGITTYNYTTASTALRNVGKGAFIQSKIFDGTALVLAGCTVGEAAFAGNSFASVEFKDAANNGCTVGKSAFAGTTTLVGTTYGNVTVSGDKPSFIGTDNGDEVFGSASYTFTYGDGSPTFNAATFGKLVVEADTTRIKQNAFKGVTFDGLDVSGEGTVIGVSAFQNSTVRNNEGNKILVSGDSVSFGQDAFLGATLGNNVSIQVTGADVTFGQTSFAGTSFASLWIGGASGYIRNGAFKNTNIAGNVTISGAGTAIGESDATAETGAFSGAQIGGKLSIAGGSAAENSTINQYAFHGAAISGADGVTIGSANAGATSVKGHAFAGATFGKLFMNTSTVNIDGDYVFAANDAYVDLYPMESTYDPPVTPLNNLTRDTTLTTVDASKAVISDESDYAFCDRAGITSLTFPAAAPTGTGVSTYAFRGCTGLGPSISVPASWTYLPTGTFYCCDGIKHLTLPSVTDAGNHIFSTRGTENSWTTITFGVQVYTIGSHAFLSCNEEEGTPPLYGRDDTHYLSYLEIHLEETPMYSVSGWDNGWDAWKIEDDHYKIFWKEIIEEYNLGSIFDRARILYKKDGGNYIVIGSKNATHVDVYTYIGESGRSTTIGPNGTPVHTEYDFAYAQNIPEELISLLQQNGITAAMIQANPKAYGVIKALGKRIVGEDVNGDEISEEYFFYYVHTPIDRTVTDDIDSWDYRYSLLRHENNFTGNNTIQQEEGFFSPPVVGENGTAYLGFSNGKFRYDFDRYLKDTYVLGTGAGKYNVTSIKETTDPLPSENNTPLYNRAFQTPGFNKIFVPDTVTEIGYKAFYGETSLKNLTYETVSGSTYTAHDYPALHLTAPVGEYAFSKCSDLTQIDFYAGTDEEPHLTSIGNYAFSDDAASPVYCSNLATLNLTRAGSIGNYAFKGCSKLPSLTFATVGNIGNYAFQGAFTSDNGSRTITINGVSTEDGNLTIGKGAFQGATKIQTLTFGSGVTGNRTLTLSDADSGSSGVFSGCTGLSTVSWGGLANIDIGNYAFSGCTPGLQSIDWSSAANNISRIGDYAFNGCSNLAGVTIGKMGTNTAKASIGTSAFQGCSALNSFAVNSGYLSAIGSNAFNGAFHNTDGSFTMSASVEQIMANAFTDTPNLKTNTFSAVGIVNGDAFAFAASGQHVHDVEGRTLTINTLGVTGYNPYGDDDQNHVGVGRLMDNALRNGRFETITISAGTIPEIGASAFTGNGKLKHVTLPNVGTLGSKAFMDCQLLEDVTFASVTTINSYAFSSDTNTGFLNNLKQVTMPNVVTIGEKAFYKAGASSGVTPLVWSAEENGLNKKLETVGISAFEECKLLDEVVMPGGAGVSVYSSAFKGSSVTEVTFQNNPPETTGSYWFQGCAGLTKVAFPNSNTWTTIPEGTFMDCANLGSGLNTSGQSVDFGAIETIGDKAFMNTGTDSNVTRNTDIPDTITAIGASAFEGCEFLDDADLSGISSEGGIGNRAFMSSTVGTLNLPDEYDGTAGVSAFEGCDNLGETDGEQKTLTVPHGWTAIPKSMFADTPLTQVTIGDENNDDGPMINAHAFSGCTALTNVTIYGAAEVGDSAFTSRTANYDFDGQPALNDPAFAENATVTMNQVKNIGACSFFDCANLKTVNMGAIESIGEEAFKNCTGLAYINYEGSKVLKDHNKYRKDDSAGYPNQSLDGNYLYQYDPDNPACTELKDYADHVAMSEDPETYPAYPNYNWKFAMCTLPKTLWQVGANAFYGTPITDLYIADIKLHDVTNNSSLANAPEVNPEGEPSNYSKYAFAGIANLNYIFIQHGYNTTSGAPWGAVQTCSVEWDDGIIGDPGSGLYYNYQTGRIVGVYKDDMTVLNQFPANLHDGRNLKNDIDLTGINTNTFYMGNSIYDIEFPAWVLELILSGNFTIEGEAFNPRMTLEPNEILRLTLLGFFDDDLADQIAAGFGLIIPGDAGFDDPISGWIGGNGGNSDPLALEELIAIFGGTDTDGDGDLDTPGVGIDTDGDGIPDSYSYWGGLIGQLNPDPNQPNAALSGLVDIISGGGSVTWEDVIEALLGYQGVTPEALIEYLGGTVEPGETYTWDDVWQQIGDGTIEECTWQDIFDLIVDAHQAKVEWLEQPTIDFGGELDDGTPLVGYVLRIQEEYPIGNQLFDFKVNELYGVEGIAFDDDVLPKEAQLRARDDLDIEHAPIVNGVKEASAQVDYEAFDAAIKRTLTYPYVDGNGVTQHSGYYKNDVDYRDSTGVFPLTDDEGNYQTDDKGDFVYDITDKDSESHIFKLTATDIGVADYLTLYDTLYCRVTFTRDNQVELPGGGQNPDYSINYTTVYEFLDPAAIDAMFDSAPPESWYQENVTDETVAGYFNGVVNGVDLRDHIVGRISFVGLFGEPQKLIYDLNTERAIALANETFGAQLGAENLFTADDVQFAEGMLEEVWMTAAYETRVQDRSPICQKTVNETDPVTGATISSTTYSLAFAGWSTKQDDTSVYTTEGDPAEKQFNQPYIRVKEPSTVPVETTLYAVWKVSENKTVQIKYDDPANKVYLQLPANQDNSLMLYDDPTEILKPKSYGQIFVGFGTDPALDNGISHMLTTAAGEFHGDLNDMLWPNVYGIYVRGNENNYKWANVQMKSLFAAWTPKADTEMHATIVLHSENQDYTLFTKYNDPNLYTDEGCTTKVQDDPNWATWPLSNEANFTGWWTAEEYGFCVLNDDGTLCQGSGTDAGNNPLSGWYGGVNGWTIGKWAMIEDVNTWTVARWVATGNRTLYAQFTTPAP